MPAGAPVLTVANAAAWRQWLAREATTSSGVWLTLAKKGTKTPTSLTMEEALEDALCYGWINGQGRKRDEATTSQRFTPRKERSAWSKRNVGIAERLEAEGRMQDAGRAAIEAAKADGRWAAAYDASASSAPPDFLAALEKVPTAKQTWEGLNSQNRYAIYFRLIALKTPAGREKRIQAFVDMLARGETPVPQKQVQRITASKTSQKQLSRSDSGTKRQTRSSRHRPADTDDT